LQEVQRFGAANPAAGHSAATLAKRMDLSPPPFRQAVPRRGRVDPAAWVESTRVAAARRLLEDGLHTPKRVAVLCGFADADTLRRAFASSVGVTPAEYRKRYVPSRHVTR
jgi:transcriptional regulator GlxA family with amidase domain